MINAVECIFCKIATGKLPSDVVYRDESVVAFKDIHPKAPVHVLVIPIKHISSLAEVSREDWPLIAHMLEAADIVAKQQGTGNAYKIVINTGGDAGQVVMHLHLHLLGGRKITSPV